MTNALFRIAAALFVLPVVGPLACEVPAGAALSTADAARMEQLETARSRALAEALMAESANEREEVSMLFASGTEPVEIIADGDYSCRTIKLGGMLPLTIYGEFDCRISGNGTRIDKTSGSQRFSGTLSAGGEGLFYQGALSYNDDKPNSYGQDPEFDQVGCLYKVEGLNRYRLEMPLPLRESTHDVIDLVPAP